MTKKKPEVGVTYYEVFIDTIEYRNPFEAEWKCVNFSENDLPIFVNPRYKLLNVREGYDFFERLKTKEEILAIIDENKTSYEEKMDSKDKFIDYMLSKIEQFEETLNDEVQFPNSFANSELEAFKKKMKELFDKDVQIPNRNRFKR